MSSKGEAERFEVPPGSPGPALRARQGLIASAFVLLLVAVGLLGAGHLAGTVAALVGSLALGGVAAWWPGFVPPPRRGLVLRGRELRFDDGGGAEQAIVTLGDDFGVTVLANRARSRAALALTSPRESFYVGAQLAGHEVNRLRSMLDQAFVVASDERALEPAAPDGHPLLLSGEALARLLDRLTDLDAHSPRRLYMTDVRGDLIVLDEAALRVGARTFDLGKSLDWRGLFFQEAGPGGLTIYQGTHVRQGLNEVVFVALLPALSSPADPGDRAPVGVGPGREVSSRERAEEPPPASQRVAIDRVFMLPIRAALDASPPPAPLPVRPGEQRRPLA